ncbi:MAG: phage baseplate assembly protein V [Novosphingobium sp.]|jgi:hypothetical protein|nr:phage baseplate assembly protein V [Novosphingobium sp.]
METMINYKDVDLNGIHTAKVLNNIDPNGRERLFVRVLGIHDITDNFKDKEFGIWVEHGTASLYRTGDIPDVDDEVWIMFLNDGRGLSPNRGIWIGCVLKNGI